MAIVNFSQPSFSLKSLAIDRNYTNMQPGGHLGDSLAL